jgi:ribosomal-protein-alanine N-acetyltransferase
MADFELRGDRVILRDFVAEDEPLFVQWASDATMYKYTVWRLADSTEAFAEFRRLLHHPARVAVPRRHWYLAMLDGAGEFAGITAFDHRLDGFGEFGWYLASRFWNKGLATEATRLFVRFGFTQLGLAAITATCDPENAASQRVLLKCGLQVVGEETIVTWQGRRARLRFEVHGDTWSGGDPSRS